MTPIFYSYLSKQLFKTVSFSFCDFLCDRVRYTALLLGYSIDLRCI